MTATATIYHRDGKTQTLEPNAAAREVQNSRGAWSFTAPPPPGWEREIPKYRATRDIQPSPKSRFRFEPPFTSVFNSDAWQYGSEHVKAGQTVETKDWPHPSFHPLNYSAGKVLEFFNARLKSRLQNSPWFGSQIRLEDGLTGRAVVEVVPPQLRQVDMRPQPARA